MGYKGSFLIVDAPLKGTAEEALAVLGVPRVRPLNEEMGIEQASYDAQIGVADYDGRTIFAGDEFLMHAIGEEEPKVRALMAALGARRAVGTWLESGTDSFGYTIVEEGRPNVARTGGRYIREMEECGESPIDRDETRAMWAELHPWEVEYLGTAEPERDDRGRPFRVDDDGDRIEDWGWGEDFVFELQRHMLGGRQDMDNTWQAVPARCFRRLGDGKTPERGCAVSRSRVNAESHAVWWWITIIGALFLTLRACGAF